MNDQLRDVIDRAYEQLRRRMPEVIQYPPTQMDATNLAACASIIRDLAAAERDWGKPAEGET